MAFATSVNHCQAIPEHLQWFVVEQHPELYTAMDHAVWRFIMTIARQSLQKSAHPQYIEGLAKTGISLEAIPLISTMNDCLAQFGWQAVAVSGFIPPAVFMEFQALKILPIACDMRKLENLGYTPAPDIVHEAAGHAPMIANADYADYLAHYGEVARKAIYAKSDLDTYLAIRNLSETKEDPFAQAEQLEAAEEDLMRATAHSSYTSEGAQLARFYWWTVEYGLVGSTQSPLIYGAGLLSSVFEAESCLRPDVLKIPFTLDAVQNSYDITRPQPQLYVTPDFKYLSLALNQFAQTMAFKTGGVVGLAKAQQAQSVCTVVLDTGLEISGVLDWFITSEADAEAVTYLHFSGPSQLSVNQAELEGHGPESHQEGYGCALGLIKQIEKPLSLFTKADWQILGFDPSLKSDKAGQLVFDSGIRLEGVLSGLLFDSKNPEKLLIAQFKNAWVKNGDQVLFAPEWGVYDLACGDGQIISVYGGPADLAQYLKKNEPFHPPVRQQKNNLTPENTQLTKLYQQVRHCREKLLENPESLNWIFENTLTTVLHQLNVTYPEDWLLSWEILELCEKYQQTPSWFQALKQSLFALSSSGHPQASFVKRGLQYLYENPC